MKKKSTSKNSYRFFPLSVGGQTIVFMIYRNGLPRILYWGKSLGKAALSERALSDWADNLHLTVTPTLLQENLMVNVLPESGRGFAHSGITVYQHDEENPEKTVNHHTQFSFHQAEQVTGKEYGTPVTTLNFYARHYYDSKNTHSNFLALITSYKIYHHSGMVKSTHELINHSTTGLVVDWLAAPVFVPPVESDHCITYGGKWSGEFKANRLRFNDFTTPGQGGIWMRENRTGRTSHESFPGVVVASTPALSQTEGSGFGVHLAWSGNHKMLIQVLPNGEKQLQLGALHLPGEVVLAPGEGIVTPVCYTAYSEAGINGISKVFHSHIRKEMPGEVSPRKVHYNSWEGVYFEHSPKKLIQIAKKAAALGAELFVLDDGWFWGRNDDTSSLGDWVVDPKKYPHGLDELVDAVHRLKLDFGLWLEPEMVNPNSRLYREHPEWVLGEPGSHHLTGRNQLVLDLRLKEVQEYLFSTISRLIEKYQLTYIKWDHNRSEAMKNAYPHTTANLAEELPTSPKAPLYHSPNRSPNRSPNTALYALLARLKRRYPKVLIESCASGGGRIDMGILAYTKRFWLSDTNDALERWRMQYHATTFFPPEYLGSHVGPRHCHTTGRELNMELRAWVAMNGHFGYEFNPVNEGENNLTLPEEKILIAITSYYKGSRAFLHRATLYRLEFPSSTPHFIAQMWVSPDKKRFFLFVGVMEAEPWQGGNMVRLVGLSPHVRYRLKPVALNLPGLKEHTTLKERWSQNQMHFGTNHTLMDKAGAVIPGELLMAGVRLPHTLPETMLVWEGMANS